MTTTVPPRALAAGLKILLACLIVVLAAGSLLAPIRDFDFFWHLRTGDWIWENRSLPQEFLFSSTAPRQLTTATRFTMTSYWMAQVALHLLHDAGGFGAIVALRFLLFGLLVISLALRREGDDFVFLGLVALFAIILRLYPLERPQAFSFVFFGFLLLALERLRRPVAASGRAIPWLIAVPALMVLWANCHGGYLIGQGVIALTLLTETLKRLSPALDPLPRERYRTLLIAGFAGLAASLVNPNTWHAIELARLPAWVTALNTEYFSTPKFFRMSGSGSLPVYWALLALAAVGTVLPGRRFDATRFALLAVTGVFSFLQVRYVAFFAIAALPAAAALLSRPRILPLGRLIALGPALLLSLGVIRSDRPVFANLTHGTGVERELLPADAAGFVLANRPEGNLYNAAGWGGYLLWRLAPMPVFVDGRNADQAIFETAMRIDDGDARPTNGLPFWKNVFRTWGIHYTVTPYFNLMDGGVHRLLDVLLADPAWIPVYADPIAVIFVESTPGNRGIIARHGMPRDRLLPRLLEYCERRTRQNPGSFIAHITRGDLLLRLGRRAEARAVYASAARMAPFNRTIRQRLASLDRGGRP